MFSRQAAIIISNLKKSPSSAMCTQSCTHVGSIIRRNALGEWKPSHSTSKVTMSNARMMTTTGRAGTMSIKARHCRYSDPMSPKHFFFRRHHKSTCETVRRMDGATVFPATNLRMFSGGKEIRVRRDDENSNSAIARTPGKEHAALLDNDGQDHEHAALLDNDGQDHEHDHHHDHENSNRGENDEFEMEQEEMFVEPHSSLKLDKSRKEWGGPRRGGRYKEPTRYGDWERKGRCSDF